MASVLSELPPKPNNLQADKGLLNEIISEAATAVGGVEAAVLTAELNVATTGTVAAADAIDETIKNQGPQIMKTLETATNFVFNGLNAIKKAEFKANAEADTAALKIDEAAKNEQIKILMENNINLTKDQAEAEYDILEKERNEKEKADAAAELKIAEAAASIDAALEIAKAKGAAAAAGGSRKKSITLSQIQKGGRQSAKRTKKSINDFFNSSVTSSQILKMVTNTNRNTKVKRKRKGKGISRRSRK